MDLIAAAAKLDVKLSGRGQGAPAFTGAAQAQFLQLPNCRIRYCIIGEGPDLVTVPDPPNTLEHHTQLLHALAPHYRVVCFEFPGFGYSTPQSGFAFDVDSLAIVMRQIFDALSVRDAVLAMACLGAYAGLRFSALNPALVRLLVLSQVASIDDAIVWSHHADYKGFIGTPFFGQWFTNTLQKRIYQQWYSSSLPEDVDPELRDRAYLKPALHSIDNGACFCLASAYQHLQRRTRLDLSQVKQPTLLLWGPKDRTHQYSTPDALARQLPDCRFVNFEHSAHFPNLEELERYVSLVLEVDQPSQRAALPAG